MKNKHSSYDLAQMQSLPLEAKIRMTKQRIKVWYESWVKYTIVNNKTGKTRFVTWTEEPCEKGCYIKRTKKVNGEKVEVDVLVPGTKLKPNEYIESALDGQVYVSLSGGKDSTVLKHIVDSMYSDVPAVFVNTGLEYPEIQQFVRSIKQGKYDCFNSDVEIIRPEMRFDEVIKNYGYPVVSKGVSKNVYYSRKSGKDNIHYKKPFGLLEYNGQKSRYNSDNWKFLYNSDFKISHRCCDVMKKSPAKKYEKQTGRKRIIGTMAEEGRQRYTAWVRIGCNSFDSDNPRSAPLSFWTEQDILRYIEKYNVPYCSVYGDIVTDKGNALKTTGCSRTGCVFCMFGCHLEKEPNRFQCLKETHPKQYEYCIGGGEMIDGKWEPNKDGLGIGKVLDYIGVKY